jgi:hypothetical protein
MEALGKTLPFLGAALVQAQRRSLQRRDRQLAGQEREAQISGSESALAEVRARRTQLSGELLALGSLIWRKESQSRLFFRRLNLAFDLQKQKMFAYYRHIAAEGGARPQRETAEPPEKDENEP